jgi:hypothetical protein
VVQLVDRLLVGEPAQDRAPDIPRQELRRPEDDDAQKPQRDDCETEAL